MKKFGPVKRTTTFDGRSKSFFGATQEHVQSDKFM